MKIVIAGAGSVGRSVALELLAHGHDITLIDNMPEKLRISPHKKITAPGGDFFSYVLMRQCPGWSDTS